MKLIVRMLLACCVLVGLISCTSGGYLYDQPRIFGMYDYIWWHMSQQQREIVAQNLTSPTTDSVNRKAFANCMNLCVPRNDSDSTGVAKGCFNKCMQRITPKFEVFYGIGVPV